jgi:hypothetical protein
LSRLEWLLVAVLLGLLIGLVGLAELLWWLG